MKVILFSSMVSLITLLILLFNRSTPKQIRIPSAFLGGRKMLVPRRLALTRPPWALWFIVLAATLGAAMAYLPPDREGRSEGAKSTGIVWIDDTFSAVVSRHESSVDPETVVDELLALEIPLVGLLPQMQMAAGRPVQSVSLVPLASRPEVTAFVTKGLRKAPNAMARPLRVEDVSRALALDSRFSGGKGALVLVADSQRATLRNFLSMRSLFESVKIIGSREPRTLRGDEEPIVPKELLSAWIGDENASSSGESDWVAISPREERLPVHARPGVVRERFGDKKDLQIVSSQSEGERIFPLAIVCTNALSGVMEFDALADLRSFLRFFSTAFRFENCEEETQAGLQMDKAAWRYRQAAAWIVPLRNNVVETLLSGRIWLPRGFVAGSDVLIFVAPIRSEATGPELLSLQTLQMESGGAPTSLYLAPLPPSENLSFRTLGSGNQERTVVFKPKLVAADGTELGYQTTEGNVFYLRTTLAMPNGELARSGEWTRFWLAVGRTAGRSSPGLRVVSVPDWSKLMTEAKTFAPETSFSLFLSPGDLRLASVPPNEDLHVGVYVSAGTFESILVEVPSEERTRDFVSAQEFERGWREGIEQTAIGEKVQREKRTLPLIGAVIATIALFLLWLFKPKFVAAGVVLLSATSLAPTSARAQTFDAKFVNVQNVPFRISWCEQDVPSLVLNRYRDLREALARRGTIRLPEEILGGRCKAGLSELWWTNSAANLLPVEVAAHLAAGGAFVLEGQKQLNTAASLESFAIPAVGLVWERPARRGMLYRSFYLLQSFDGCLEDKTMTLRLRKKVNAQSLAGISTSVSFLNGGQDCFVDNDEFRVRSFVNLMYALLTTDYKEDHMQLPELLSRVRNLGLEP